MSDPTVAIEPMAQVPVESDKTSQVSQMIPIKRALSPSASGEPTNTKIAKEDTENNDNNSNNNNNNNNGNNRNRQKKKKTGPKPRRFKEPPVADPVSPEGVLITDIKTFLASKEITEQQVINNLREFFTRPRDFVHPEHRVVTVTIEARSGSGEGIGLVKLENSNVKEGESTTEQKQEYQVVVIPFTVIGDVVEAKIYKTQRYYFNAELLKVITPSPQRDDSLIKCKYFGKCSGCQYQMISYDDQLEIKRNVIVNAYKHNSDLDSALIPDILPTFPSPKQFYYRTKLTPHFDINKKTVSCPPVGFAQPGRKAIIDIEECPIGTPVINQGLTKQREWLKENYTSYKRAATFLLRENTIEKPKEDDPSVVEKTTICATSTKDIITEYVGDKVFKFPASSFFQNNNSILVDVTNYVKENIVLPKTGLPPTYLVDAYCGCGLFSITCCGSAKSVIGVEISQDSVRYAQKNAELNNVDAQFVVGQAERIFENVDTDPQETSIIIDPPRKGCDELFLNQLLKFKPAKIVYISCNVHSQARDIGYLLKNNKEEDSSHYVIESIRGFDFFPQTHHVESVAVLSLKDKNS